MNKQFLSAPKSMQYKWNNTNIILFYRVRQLNLNSQLSNSQPVSSATLDSTRVAQIRIPWEKAEISSSQR